ncbi:ComF family protein [Paenibacillus lentus]|uniref:ComF family protein n=2 Tax=Paenibacillus lentus TaxID=1338368 RepID=A0A3Q8SEU7_9BACL|nr:ComF family protein [Paenibacillus lentus]
MFGQFWSGVLKPIHQLLAKGGSNCLACGKTISICVPGYSELCLPCYSSIPWITEPRCHICGRHVGCPDCSRKGGVPRSFVMNRSSVAYNSTMRQWLAQYKYRGHEGYSLVLARMMGRAMEQMKQELKPQGIKLDGVVFVPLSEERWRERGFNQAEELAKGAALAGRRAGGRLPLLNLLMRSRHTDKQSFKSRSERLINMQGVFQTLPDATEQLGRVILGTRRTGLDHEAVIRLLLVDDVYTTGSTINACAAVLQNICGQLGFSGEIYSLTWARS